MSILKCKMCGADLEPAENSRIAVCEYCGTRQTIPLANDEKKLTAFARAERLRSAGEFDRAAGLYETIIGEYPEEAEAYWDLLLCKYGISYVDDPASGRKLPTFHRLSWKNVLEDTDFEQALENASSDEEKKEYRREARELEELRRNTALLSTKQEPFDVFLSYKDTDENGERTEDSVLAGKLYDDLTGMGYRVFYSRVTLANQLGRDYEPIIFSALNTAGVMLVIGTRREYFEAVWVKNEWSRCLQMMDSGQKKSLIPCYTGTADCLPEEFSARHLPTVDLGKTGAILDLLHGVEKLIPPKKADHASSGSAAPDAEDLWQRSAKLRQDGNWSDAIQLMDQVLDADPKSGRAYFERLLAEAECRDKAELAKRSHTISYLPSFDNAVRFAEPAFAEELRRMADDISARETAREEQAKKDEAFGKAKSLLEKIQSQLALAGDYGSLKNSGGSTEDNADS